MRHADIRNWWSHAACQTADPNLFFPVSATERSDDKARAKQVCARCPVRGECLTHALNAGAALLGVWGGASETDRARLRRVRANAARLAITPAGLLPAAGASPGLRNLPSPVPLARPAICFLYVSNNQDRGQGAIGKRRFPPRMACRSAWPN